MRYVLLAVLITGSAALSGCFNDNDNSSDLDNKDVATDQAKAELAVERTSAVIDASNNVDTDEPQDIDRIVLPEADSAEPVAIEDANASL